MPIIMDLSGPALHTYDSVYPTYNFQPMIADRGVNLPLTGLGRVRVVRDPVTGRIRRVNDLRGGLGFGVESPLVTPLLAVAGLLVGAYLAGARLKR